MDWLWWIGAGLLFALVEVVTLSFVLLMLSGGAVAAAVASAFGLPFWVQAIVFAVVSVVLLITVRRWLVRRFRDRTPRSLTNSEALVGREALALGPVSPGGGRVKLGGEVWTARVPDDAPAIPNGHRVRIVRIEGATAVVEPLTVGI
jgi:membrane protein implicated in regulation of membrane protease activity